MSNGIRPAVVVCLVGLGGCAHDSRVAATHLSQAGVKATSALATSVEARADRLRADRAALDFNFAYAIMRTCPPGTITYGTSENPNCDVAALARARRGNPVNDQIALLADVVAKRSRALQALSAAYAALGDEAGYDAAGELEKAIGSAFASVNSFGQAVGLGSAPALVGTGAKLIGGALAGNAQRRRLVAGSRRIAAITHHMRLAMINERGLFGRLDGLLGDLDQETRSQLLKTGLLDPSATLKSIVANTGISVPDAAVSAAVNSSPAVRGAAQVAMLDAAPGTSSADLDAGIALLADVEAEHAKFERGQPLDLQDIAADIDRLSTLMSAARK